jgi:hypothetical protein
MFSIIYTVEAKTFLGNNPACVGLTEHGKITADVGRFLLSA